VIVVGRGKADSLRLPPAFCRSLNRACRTALPPWVRVQVVPRPGGYDVKAWSLRPSAMSSERGRFREIDSRGDLERAAREAMTRVQHIVGRSTGVAWPSAAPIHVRFPFGAEPGSADRIRAWLQQFPEPHARLEGAELTAWFGPPEDPILELPAAQLDWTMPK
jgi:hypothetical protein